MAFGVSRSRPEPVVSWLYGRWPPSSGTEAYALSNYGVAHGLRVNAETIGDLLQREPVAVEDGRARTALVVQSC